VRRIRLGEVDLVLVSTTIAIIALILTLLVAYGLSTRIENISHSVNALSKNMEQVTHQIEILNQKVAELIRYSPYFTG